MHKLNCMHEVRSVKRFFALRLLTPNLHSRLQLQKVQGLKAGTSISPELDPSNSPALQCLVCDVLESRRMASEGST